MVDKNFYTAHTLPYKTAVEIQKLLSAIITRH